MTEFSFDLFIASVPIKVISKFDHVVLENLNIYRMRNTACVLDIHWGNVLVRPRSPILVTYNGIHAQLQKTEGRPGGRVPRKIFASYALQIAGKHLFNFVIYSRLFR